MHSNNYLYMTSKILAVYDHIYIKGIWKTKGLLTILLCYKYRKMLTGRTHLCRPNDMKYQPQHTKVSCGYHTLFKHKGSLRYYTVIQYYIDTSSKQRKIVLLNIIDININHISFSIFPLFNEYQLSH